MTSFVGLVKVDPAEHAHHLAQAIRLLCMCDECLTRRREFADPDLWLPLSTETTHEFLRARDGARRP